MAELWFCYEGPEPTRGAQPAYDLPLKECIERLDVSQTNFLQDLSKGPSEKGPRFDDRTGLGTIAGFKHIVLKLDEVEARDSGWKPGFYYVSLNPDEAVDRLGPPNEPFPDAT